MLEDVQLLDLGCPSDEPKRHDVTQQSLAPRAAFIPVWSSIWIDSSAAATGAFGHGELRERGVATRVRNAASSFAAALVSMAAT